MMLKLLGFEFRVSRTGRLRTPPPDPSPKPAVKKMTPAQVLATFMRPRTCVLPVAGFEVTLRPPTTRVMVEAGLSIAAMIPPDHTPTEAEAEAHMERVRVQARRLWCAAAEAPTFRPHPRPGHLDILDVCDEDLLFVYNMLIEWGTSIFYGTHRSDLHVETDAAWVQAQGQAAAIVDALARRYGVLPSALEALPPADFARVMAYADAGEAALAEAAADLPKPGKRRRR